MKTKIKDIAVKLGIDLSTVSYALSGKGTIKPETRDLIRRTAAEMGYVANASARKISTGESNQVGVVMPNALFGYGEFVQHCFRMLSDTGIETSIALTEFSERREEAVLRQLLENGVSGLIVKSRYESLELAPQGHPLRLAAMNKLPVLSFGTPMLDSPFCAVDLNFHGSGVKLGKLFRKTGRKSVKLLVPHPPPFFKNVTDLLEGLEEGGAGKLEISALGLDDESLPSRDAESLNPVYEAQMQGFLAEAGTGFGRKLFAKLAKEEKLPDAAVCLNERAAVGFLDEARKAGVEIPREMALACAERSLFLSMAPVHIASAAPSFKTAAESSVSLLLDMISGKAKGGRNIELEPELEEGDTI